MAQRSIQPDLARERTKASFDTENLTNFLYGGKEKVKRKRHLENIAVQDPHFKTFKPWAFCGPEEKYDMALGKHMYIEEKLREMGIVDRMERQFYIDCAAPNEPNPLGVHNGMFVPTIEKQGTPEQKKRWLPLIEKKKMFGTYAQTELGHGTFIRGLETTATYDPKTREFVINSPTLTSMKYWPGGLGLSTNHCIIAAQLYTQGKCHGLHMFMVQIRNMKDHSPMPGVEVGVIGTKFGYNTNDNGFLRLSKVRIPRENMLMRFSQVLEDGTFIKPKNSKLAYGTMVLIRVFIVLNTSVMLAKACTISIRYSAVRRQTEIKPGGEEQLILNYQTQQYRLFPLLASAYCLRMSGDSIYNRYLDINKQIEQGNTEDLAELHALSAGLKAFSSYVCCNGIETCRLCCGGHGYSHASGLPKIYQTISPSCTYEGENTVMLLQAARYLMKCYSKALQGQQLPTFVQYIGQKLEPKSYMTEEVSLNCMLKAYEHRAARLVQSAAKSMQSLIQAGKPQHEAWNGSSVQLMWAANAHCHLFSMKTFMETIQSPKLEPRTAMVLKSLCQLYAVHGILENLGEFVQDGFLSGIQVSYLQKRLWALFEEIRPNAVALVDAFDFSDMSLDSCLGRYDGQVYQALYDYAKSAPMNAEEVHSTYYKHLKPLMHPESSSDNMKYAKL